MAGTIGAGRPLRVFLGHTEELARLPDGDSFVRAAKNAIETAGHAVVEMATWTAHPTPPAQVCREAVESCDVYAGLLGFRYGSPVRDQPDRSYTELEFDTAVDARLPLFVFLLGPDTPGTRELLVDEEHGPAQARFRRRVDDAGITHSVVRTPRELELRVFQALVGMRTSRMSRIPTRNPVFTGREEALAALRSARDDGEGGVAQVVHGMGGMGKSALVLEYAHRHAEDYDVVWWLPARDPGLVSDGLVELAQALRLVAATDPAPLAIRLLHDHLRERGRWLIVFDNADRPATVAPHLVAGPGHVLITSRDPGWAGVATPFEIDRLDTASAVTLLRKRAAHLTDRDARRVAEAVDNLPLALTQAGGYLVPGGIGAVHYAELVEQRTQELMARGEHLDYPESFAASWTLALDRLDADAPAAAQLMSICSYLPPEPVPIGLFTDPGQAERLPEPLCKVVADPIAFADLVHTLRSGALARIDAETIHVHRLVQALLRDRQKER